MMRMRFNEPRRASGRTETNDEALAKRMAEKAEEFVKKGGEAYAKA